MADAFGKLIFGDRPHGDRGLRHTAEVSSFYRDQLAFRRYWRKRELRAANRNISAACLQRACSHHQPPCRLWNRYRIARLSRLPHPAVRSRRKSRPDDIASWQMPLDLASESISSLDEGKSASAVGSRCRQTGHARQRGSRTRTAIVLELVTTMTRTQNSVATNPEQDAWSNRRKREKHWKRWGPYLSERAWGTVREDYSAYGTAWDSFPHDHARSRAYRWNEDGLGGICDNHQNLCFALALWNGKDPILKERLFGLTGSEGNHGEDVKEYYFYLDSTPTHSYMKFLYKYPQQRISLSANLSRRTPGAEPARSGV